MFFIINKHDKVQIIDNVCVDMKNNVKIVRYVKFLYKILNWNI